MTVTLSQCNRLLVTEKRYTAGELAEAVNTWCSRHDVVPANGQSGEAITERNVRFYRTMGLVDAPESGAGFGERQRLQLVAIRLLQAQGLPLRRIRELLHGRSDDELRRVEKQGLAEIGKSRAAGVFPVTPGGLTESWSVQPLNEDYLLVSRRGRPVSAGVRDAIRKLLEEEKS